MDPIAEVLLYVDVMVIFSLLFFALKPIKDTCEHKNTFTFIEPVPGGAKKRVTCMCCSKTLEKSFQDVETCFHDDTYIRVIDATVTCETTEIVCRDCGDILSGPIQDCR